MTTSRFLISNSKLTYYPDSAMNATNSYPDTISESNKVIKKMKNSDSEYFLMSDESPVKPFTEYMDRHKLDYDAKKLKSIVLESYQPIKSLKDYYNRPRRGKYKMVSTFPESPPIFV